MKHTIMYKNGWALVATASLVALTIAPAAALKSRVTAGDTTTVTKNNPAKVQLIINRGNAEITRRLTTLNTLTVKLNSASKLTDANKASLTTEVNAAINGLNGLKTTLDADTTVESARADAQSIINDYRVYALLVPKVGLIKTADDQQVAEAKLTALAPKLQSRIDQAKANGKQVTALQSAITDLNTKVQAAQSISTSIESSVIDLQPSDYNSDHTILNGDRAQLVTAQSNIKAALSDAKTVVNSLKNL